MKKLIFLLLLSSATALHAASARDIIIKGNKDYKAKKYGAALDKYNQLPEDKRALFDAADAQYYLKDYAKADEIYDSLGPGPDTTFNRGNIAFRRGNMEDAVKFYRELLVKNPKDKAALHNLQLALESKNENQDSQNQKQDENKEEQNNDSSPQGQNQDQENNSSQQQKEEEMQRLLQMAREQEQKNKERADKQNGGAGSSGLGGPEKDW